MGKCVRWGDIAQLVYGKALKDYDGNDHRPVRVYGTNGPIGYTDVSQSSGPRVILGRKGAYRGVHLARGEFWVIDTAYYLEHDERVDAVWAYYALLNTDIHGLGSGSAIPSTTREDFYALGVRLPSLRVQLAVAEVLGALDDKIAANERIGTAAFELAHSLALGLLRPANGHTPQLVRTKFGALGELLDGPHATPTRRSDGPYFLNISSLKSGRLDLAESDHVSESDFAKWTRRVVPQEGDLLFSYETRIGEAALMPGGLRACLGRRMALLRPDRTRVDPAFLLHFYLAPAFQQIIAAHTIHGATVPRIGLATIPNWDVEIPTLEEQLDIADALGALHEAMVQSERESDWLARTRDELLPLLMSGKVRVKDAEAQVSDLL